MARRAVVRRVTTGVDVSVEVLGVVGPHNLVAVVLLVAVTLGTLALAALAGVALCADTHAVADLDAGLDVFANPDCHTDNLVSNC